MLRAADIAVPACVEEERVMVPTTLLSLQISEAGCWLIFSHSDRTKPSRSIAHKNISCVEAACLFRVPAAALRRTEPSVVVENLVPFDSKKKKANCEYYGENMDAAKHIRFVDCPGLTMC